MTKFEYQATLLASFTVAGETRKAAEAKLRDALGYGSVCCGTEGTGSWSQRTGVEIEGDLDFDAKGPEGYTFDATLLANFTIFDETAAAAEKRLREGLEGKTIEVGPTPNGLTFAQSFEIEGEIDLMDEDPFNEADLVFPS